MTFDATACLVAVLTLVPLMSQAQPAPDTALDGQYNGPVSTISHPRGWFSFEVPQGWAIAQQNDEAMIIMIISGMVGLSTDIGGNTEEWGTYEVTGDDVTLTFRDGADTLKLVVEQGRVAALARDGRTYRRRR